MKTLHKIKVVLFLYTFTIIVKKSQNPIFIHKIKILKNLIIFIICKEFQSKYCFNLLFNFFAQSSQ